MALIGATAASTSRGYLHARLHSGLSFGEHLGIALVAFADFHTGDSPLWPAVGKKINFVCLQVREVIWYRPGETAVAEMVARQIKRGRFQAELITFGTKSYKNPVESFCVCSDVQRGEDQGVHKDI